ncbi:MAG: hypothetical protein JO093_13980 [Acidobacteria bacterium]|nr:hypothetical protein [Acidobacteriota bacterium]MBV9068576.1 hypothetical protein [Acidobacteriota bacterium]MBV9186724.1 hypothetical protein [Acidobacteriota bacterium]
MSASVVIEQGDTVARLAERFGLAPDTIWNDPANADLRKLRADMNILAAGDVVVVRDKVARSVAAQTGRVHRFRRHGVPTLFRVRVLVDGKPLGEQPYVLAIDDGRYEGTTGADGSIERYIPNGARAGSLSVGPSFSANLSFGHMDPIDTESGVAKRLDNLGFRGPLDAALQRFRELHGMEPGGIDAALRAKLQEAHDTATPASGV